MDITITKRGLRDRLGSEARDADIARFFDITTSPVAQWPEEDPIPEKRALQAWRKRPEWFGESEPVRAVG